MKSINSCYLDTNVLVSFLQEDSLNHQKSISLITKLASQNLILCISPLCLDEFLHSLRKIHYHKTKTNIQNKSIYNYLKKILSLPYLEIVNPPFSIKSQLQIPLLMDKFKLSPRDAYHLLTIRHHKIKHFVTFDSDFELVFKNTSLKSFTD